MSNRSMLASFQKVTGFLLLSAYRPILFRFSPFLNLYGFVLFICVSFHILIGFSICVHFLFSPFIACPSLPFSLFLPFPSPKASSSSIVRSFSLVLPKRNHCLWIWFGCWEALFIHLAFYPLGNKPKGTDHKWYHWWHGNISLLKHWRLSPVTPVKTFSIIYENINHLFSIFISLWCTLPL